MEQQATFGKTQYAQLKARKGDGRYLEKLALKMWLKQINEPVAFLALKWQSAADFTSHLRAYSLDLFNESLEHFGSNELELTETAVIENLLAQLPPSGTILVYVKKRYLARQIDQLAARQPALAESILALKDRIVDAGTIFVEGYLYDIKMNDNYSLASVRDSFCQSEFETLVNQQQRIWSEEELGSASLYLFYKFLQSIM